MAVREDLTVQAKEKASQLEEGRANKMPTGVYIWKKEEKITLK